MVKRWLWTLCLLAGCLAATGRADPLQAGAVTAASPSAEHPSVVLIPLEGAIQWQQAVDTFEKTLKAACQQQPRVIIFQISGPGGVVDYAWDMIGQIKGLPGITTVAWVSGRFNGAFSSAAILALSCDRVYIADGQTIGGAVPYDLDTSQLPRNASVKWASSWHSPVRALCEKKHRPWPVVRALLSPSAGLFRIQADSECEYANYDRIRPLLKPDVRARTDAIVRQAEDSDNVSAARPQVSRPRQVFADEMPRNVEAISPLGEALALTARESVRSGLCDGLADTLEQVLQAMRLAPDTPLILSNPLADADTSMEPALRSFQRAVAAVGATVRSDNRGHPTLQFNGARTGDVRTLSECCRLRTLIDRYPDLATGSQVRIDLDSAIRDLQIGLQRKKEAQRKAQQTQQPPHPYQQNTYQPAAKSSLHAR